MSDQAEANVENETSTEAHVQDQDTSISTELNDLWSQALMRGDFNALWPDLII